MGNFMAGCLSRLAADSARGQKNDGDGSRTTSLTHQRPRKKTPMQVVHGRFFNMILVYFAVIVTGTDACAVRPAESVTTTFKV